VIFLKKILTRAQKMYKVIVLKNNLNNHAR